MEYTKLPQIDPKIHSLIQQEQVRQREQLQLIPSENYPSKAVLEPLSSVLSNKYSEGYPGKRYYQGSKFIDEIEELAIKRAKKLFGAEYINVQPLSGTPANFAVYLALLNPGDTILSMDMASGGHVSHGNPINAVSKYYKVVTYSVNPENETLDYDEIQKIAEQKRPRLIIAGATAYSRIIDYAKFAEIAYIAGAYLMVDMAHIAGLVAGLTHPSPVHHADVVTATTHKTLRGPRGGFILAKEKYSKQLDRAIFPGGIQAGPHNNVHAAKAVCLHEALQPQFQDYARQVVKNSQHLATQLQGKGYRIVSRGTDNHLMLIDLRNKKINGKDAAVALEQAGIIVNFNLIPFDPNPPTKPSGIRLGTPAVTSRGMKEEDMYLIAEWIDRVLQDHQNEAILIKVAEEVKFFASEFPVPGIDD